MIIQGNDCEYENIMAVRINAELKSRDRKEIGFIVIFLVCVLYAEYDLCLRGFVWHFPCVLCE
jgi:hypothetical protein